MRALLVLLGVLSLLAVEVQALRAPMMRSQRRFVTLHSSNVDEFGAGGANTEAVPESSVVVEESSESTTPKGQKLSAREQMALDAANKLRQEADEME